MRLIAASLLVAAIAAGCKDTPPPKQEPPVPSGDEGEPDGPIVKGRMYQDLQQHTNSPAGADDVDPCVSADGAILYFASNRHSRFYDLYAKPTRGPAMTILTTRHPECHKRFPALSPDGKRIAFASDWKGGWDLYVLDLSDPSADWRVVSAFPEDEFRPSWSPDGARVAFCRRSTKFGGWEVWGAGVDGTSPGPIADGYLPVWGPVKDQAWIVFQRPRQRDDPWFGLWKARPDGNLLTELLPAETFGAVTPCWSPDGAWIAFSTVSRKEGTEAVEEVEDIHVLSSDGRVRMQITSQAGVEAMPFWGQDGRIYYASSAGGAEGHFNIWSLKPILPP